MLQAEGFILKTQSGYTTPGAVYSTICRGITI